MGHVLFTGKPSKVSKNSSGHKLEIEFSKDFHSEGLPLLVSPALLRSRDLGQIDLARLKKDKEGWVVEVGEVKSSELGVEQMVKSQMRRLFASQKFLASVFGHRTKLVRLVKK